MHRPCTSTVEDHARQPTIRARVPAPLLRAVDEAAERAGQRRSTLVRELLTLGLAERGLWPPAPAAPTTGR